jgi:thiamine kinase-like enzyme
MNSANRCTRADIENWLRLVLKKENLENYSIDISGSTEKGDGYIGDVTFVDVRGTTNTNEKKSYEFVIKSGKKSSQLREMIPVRNAFENEIYFYNEILPVFREFQAEKGITDPFDNTPKFYDSIIEEEMEVLILGNMKTSGYSLHDRFNPMDQEHIRKIIKVYGKLHAISFALRDQKPEVFKELGGKLTDMMKLSAKYIKPKEDRNNYEDIIKIAKEKKEDDVVAKLNILNERAKRQNEITDPNDPYAVILHGDCWNNNFMFKYANNNKTKLLDVCFLDFQLSRLASPVYDLSYFLFTCLSEDDIPNFDEIVNVYYESLSEFLRKLGSDPDKMFPFEELQKQWKRFSLFGLTMLSSVIKVCLSDKDEVNDLAEVAESGRQITDAFTKAVKNAEEFGKRTLPIIKLAIDKGFI